VSVFSPRGGSGKTMVAVNTAVLLARMFPDRVALLDLGVTFSHDGLFLGIEPGEGIAAIEPDKLENLDRETLNHYAYTHSSSLRLYTAAVKPEEGESVTGEHVKAVLELMKRQFLFIVIDLPSNFNEPTLAAIEISDKLVLITTPELSSLRDVREVLRLFNDTIRVPRQKHYYVLNAPSPVRGLTREQIESTVELEMNAEIPNAGESAFRSYVKGEPLVLASSGSATSKAMEKVVADIAEGAGGVAAPVAARGRLLGKLLGKRS
jgi:pilus assembly protein CpaE